MTLAELIELVRQRLGGSETFYPAALLIPFLDHAQRLLALQSAYRVLQRAAYTLVAGELLIDLRALLPRALQVRRVLLGNVSTQEESRSLGLLQPLFRTTLATLAARSGWLATQDVPRQWFPHGKTLLGVWPRPSTTTTVTVMATGLPTPFTTNDLTMQSDIQASNHSFIADVATGLLLMREGTLEGDKGLQMLRRALSDQQLRGLRTTLERMQRQQRQGTTAGVLDAAAPTV